MVFDLERFPNKNDFVEYLNRRVRNANKQIGKAKDWKSYGFNALEIAGIVEEYKKEREECNAMLEWLGETKGGGANDR